MIPNLLSYWNPVPGQQVTETRLEALINRLEAVLTGLDGTDNLGAASVLLGNLAYPKQFLQIVQAIVEPTHNAAGNAWLPPATYGVLGSWFSGAYTKNLTMYRVPTPSTLVRIWAQGRYGAAGRDLQLWRYTAGVGVWAQVPAAELLGVGSVGVSELGLSVGVFAGDFLAWRVSGVADPDLLPIDVGMDLKCYHQVA